MENRMGGIAQWEENMIQDAKQNEDRFDHRNNLVVFCSMPGVYFGCWLETGVHIAREIRKIARWIYD
jgi:hypothetical protein